MTTARQSQQLFGLLHFKTVCIEHLFLYKFDVRVCPFFPPTKWVSIQFATVRVRLLCISLLFYRWTLFYTPFLAVYIQLWRGKEHMFYVFSKLFFAKKYGTKNDARRNNAFVPCQSMFHYSCKKKLTSSYVSSMHWWMRSKEEWAENNSTTISTVMIKLMTKITIVNKKYIDDLVTLSHYIYRFMHSK